MTISIIIVAIILLSPPVCDDAQYECKFVSDARITEYVPEWGGNNCMEPCDMTAFMVPVTYGITAACGPGIPYNTIVTFITPWGEVVTRRCQDRGGGIKDGDVDVAMPPDDNGYYYSSSGKGWPTLWCWEREEVKHEIVRSNAVMSGHIFID